jgi:hypothetical protein
MRPVYALAIPILLVLAAAAALERRVHAALFALRHGDPDAIRSVPGRAPIGRRIAIALEQLPFPPGSATAWNRLCVFLASDAGVLSVITLLAGTGIVGLILIQ